MLELIVSSLWGIEPSCVFISLCQDALKNRRWMFCTLACDGTQHAIVVLIIWKNKVLIFTLVNIRIFNPFSLGSLSLHSPN